MPESSHHPDLYIRRVRGMGRGVFAGRAFRKREVIEACPVLVLPTCIPGVGLEDYVYKWGYLGTELAVALGYGSLYNHSPTPNAEFYTRIAKSEIVYRAVRDISAGEQILIDYQWDPTAYAAYAMRPVPVIPSSTSP